VSVKAHEDSLPGGNRQGTEVDGAMGTERGEVAGEGQLTKRHIGQDEEGEKKQLQGI